MSFLSLLNIVYFSLICLVSKNACLLIASLHCSSKIGLVTIFPFPHKKYYRQFRINCLCLYAIYLMGIHFRELPHLGSILKSMSATSASANVRDTNTNMDL